MEGYRLGVDLSGLDFSGLNLIVEFFGVIANIFHQIHTKSDDVFYLRQMLRMALMRQTYAQPTSCQQNSDTQHLSFLHPVLLFQETRLFAFRLDMLHYWRN